MTLGRGAGVKNLVRGSLLREFFQAGGGMSKFSAQLVGGTPPLHPPSRGNPLR